MGGNDGKILSAVNNVHASLESGECYVQDVKDNNQLSQPLGLSIDFFSCKKFE